jgi:hypothetical protein
MSAIVIKTAGRWIGRRSNSFQLRPFRPGLDFKHSIRMSLEVMKRPSTQIVHSWRHDSDLGRIQLREKSFSRDHINGNSFNSLHELLHLENTTLWYPLRFTLLRNWQGRWQRPIEKDFIWSQVSQLLLEKEDMIDRKWPLWSDLLSTTSSRENEEVPVWRQVPLGQKWSCFTLLKVFQVQIFSSVRVSTEGTKTGLICAVVRQMRFLVLR